MHKRVAPSAPAVTIAGAAASLPLARMGCCGVRPIPVTR